MNTNKETARIWEDAKINVRIKLSALWVALMFLYTYADILGFYTPGTLEQLMAGEAGGIQITEGFLMVMAVWMAIPSVMVFLSLTVKANVNRWMNIIAGVLSILILGTTFLVGDITLRYVFQAAVEGALIATIVWYSWTWPKKAR